MQLLELKQRAHQQCLHWVKAKITDLEHIIGQMDQSGEVDTKSSMGDKYETSQAMMHLEKEKYQSQMAPVLSLQKVLYQINPQTSSQVIALGTFLDTDQGYIYLSIPAGVLTLEDMEFTAISPTSPLGQAFKEAELDQPFNFRGRSYRLQAFC